MDVSISMVENILHIGGIPISNTNIWTIILLSLIFAVLMYLKKFEVCYVKKEKKHTAL